MIGGSVFLIHVESGAVERIQCIQPDTALKTGACFLPQQAHHSHFFHQIIDALMNMSEAVNLFAAQVRVSGHDSCMFGSMRQLIGHSCRVDMWLKHGLIDNIGNFLPHKINFGR
jgi:hypothetical protein